MTLLFVFINIWFLVLYMSHDSTQILWTVHCIINSYIDKYVIISVQIILESIKNCSTEVHKAYFKIFSLLYIITPCIFKAMR